MVQSPIPSEIHLPHICSRECSSYILMNVYPPDGDHDIVFKTLSCNIKSCRNIIDIPDNKIAYFHWSYPGFCSRNCETISQIPIKYKYNTMDI